MNKLGEMFKKVADNHIKTLKECTDFYCNNLPDIPNVSSVNISTGSEPWIELPYNRNLIHEIENSLVEQGWEKSWELKESDLSKNNNRYPRQSWEKEIEGRTEYPYRSRFVLSFRDDVEGATCIRKVIGKETKEIDIVEFVCVEKQGDLK